MKWPTRIAPITTTARMKALTLLLLGFLSACTDEPLAPSSLEPGPSAEAPLTPTFPILTPGRRGVGWLAAEGWLESMDSYNSTGGTNRLEDLGEGRYRVTMPGLGGLGGTVQMSGYNCHPLSWVSRGLDLVIQVECDPYYGDPYRNLSVLFYREDRTDTRGGYVWANQPTATRYTPSAAYQWNPTGQSNRIDRLGTGSYRVFFPGKPVTRGVPLVTAYGSGPGACKPSRWEPLGVVAGGAYLYVLCLDEDLRPQDRRFTASLVTDNRLGAPTGGTSVHGAFIVSPFPRRSYNSTGGRVAIAGSAYESFPDLYIDGLEPRESAVSIVQGYGATPVRCVAYYVDHAASTTPPHSTRIGISCDDPRLPSWGKTWVALHLTNRLSPTP